MRSPSQELDGIDCRIIRALADDASLSNNELAEKVGLTPAPLSRRLARLYGRGILRKSVEVNAAFLGIGLQAYLEVTLDRTASNVGERFLALIDTMPEVVECHTVAGTFDFLLKIAVTDIAAYKDLIWSRLQHLTGIKTLRSAIILDTNKHSPCPLP